MIRHKTHKCAGPVCREAIPVWTHLCQDCWKALPGWLRHQLYDEKRVCKASGIKHSQELLRLEGLAVTHLTPKPHITPAVNTAHAESTGAPA